MDRLDQIADDLLAFHSGSPFERQYEGAIADLSIEDAYSVQDRLTERRERLGQRPVGYKIGCTSKAIREQVGLSEPICGRVMSPHVYFGETTLRFDDFADCAVEPEFVFKLARDVTEADLRGDRLADVIESVAPGIEVHRYRFNYGEPTSQELIASNGIHACLVIGETHRAIGDLDLDLEAVELFANGKLAASGIGAEIQGGPLKSLAWLAQTLLKRGTCLKAGELVIPGSPVPLIPVARGEVIESRFTHFGQACARFE